MSEYDITDQMRGVIKSIAGLRQEKDPCHGIFLCNGLGCGLIDISNRFIEEHTTLGEDFNGYGDQLINIAVKVYRSRKDQNRGGETCNVAEIYDKLALLGEIAFPQFVARDQG